MIETEKHELRFGREYDEACHDWIDIATGRSKRHGSLVKLPSGKWGYCSSWGDDKHAFPDGIMHWTAPQLRAIADKLDELNGEKP